MCRDEHFQTKRAHLGCFESSSVPLSTPHMDHALIRMPVDEALSFIGKVPDEEFIKDAQKIQFDVSHRNSNFGVAC